jgi:hypothetical protein
MTTLIAHIHGHEVHVYSVDLAELQSRADGTMYLPATGVVPPQAFVPPYFPAATSPGINISGAGFDEIVAKVHAGEHALAVATGKAKAASPPEAAAADKKPNWDPYL